MAKRDERVPCSAFISQYKMKNWSLAQ